MTFRKPGTARNACGRYLVWSLAGVLYMAFLSACQPGPPTTPTLPAVFVESPVPPPVSPTPRPLLTPPPSPANSPTAEPTEPAAITPLVATYTPSATAWIAGTPTSAFIGTPPSGQLEADSAERLVATPSSGINALPIPAVVSVSELPATPVNAGFEGLAIRQGAPEINVPQGWTAWWRVGTVDCTIYRVLGTSGPCPVFDEPDLSYRRPEFTVIPSSGPWLDPPRVLGEGSAARFFCTYGVCMAGYLQRVQVTPGQSYTLSAWVQSWCTDDSSDHAHSQLDTEDARLNCELAVGLDPNAGLDPLSPDVVWAAGYAYDAYSYVITPPVQAMREAMTLFLRGRSLWGLKHNDFHFDQVTFRAE